MRWIGIVLMGLAVGSAQQDSRTTSDESPIEARLFLFFSPTDRDLATLAGEVRCAMAGLEKRGVRAELRPVLLLPDSKTVGKLHANEPFFNMVKKLSEIRGPSFEIRIYDEEGLAWAERLAIERTPAWVLVQGKRAHLAYGVRARIEEAASCGGR